MTKSEDKPQCVSLSKQPYVKPRYTHLTSIHRKLGKYSKRIGRRNAKEFAMFASGKLYSRSV